MSLGLYYYNDIVDQYISISSGDQSSPFTVSHNVDDTVTIERQIFIKNDDLNKYYTGVSVSAYPVSLVEEGNAVGWIWKILEGSTQPNTYEWAAATYTLTITGVNDTQGNIGDITAGYTQYIPLWIRVELPSGIPVGNYTNIKFRVSYDTEGNVVYGS